MAINLSNLNIFWFDNSKVLRCLFWYIFLFLHFLSFLFNFFFDFLLLLLLKCLVNWNRRSSWGLLWGLLCLLLRKLLQYSFCFFLRGRILHRLHGQILGSFVCFMGFLFLLNLNNCYHWLCLRCLRLRLHLSLLLNFLLNLCYCLRRSNLINKCSFWRLSHFLNHIWCY